MTTKEISDLETLENIIKISEKATFAFLAACSQIKERKLYRRDYDTWEVYCLKRWGWKSERQRQIENAGLVIQQLAKESPTIGREISNERQARELAKIPKESRVKVIKSIVDSGAKVTAKAIAAHVEKPDIELDSKGRAIPNGALVYWERASEVNSMLTQISRVKCALESAQESSDKMYAEVNFSLAISCLEKAWTSIKCAKPYVVCTTCQGHPETQPDGNCRLCLGRGLISEYRWKHLVPEEIKAVVEKGVK